MNAPVLVAQLSGSAPQSSAPPKNLKLEKPQNGQAVTIHLDGNTRLDFSDISTEKLTFVRVGEKLIVLFDNQSTVTVDPVFDSGGHPLADVAFDLGQNRLVTGDEFATLFPITTDQSVLPAAGGNSGPTGGANFSDAHVNALTDPNAPLALLGDENNGSQFGAPTDISGNAPLASEPFSSADLNEADLPGGSTEGAGPTSFTYSLGVDFGSGLGSATLTFNDLQPGLAGLRSQGEVVNFALSADHMTLIGFVGGDPNVAANQVFIVTLNLSADSSYTVTLLRPLDHSGAGADTLGFTLDITAQDTFGSVETHVTINVQDDVAGLNGAIAAHGVTEDGLAAANGFVAGDGSTGTVELNINWGADSDTRGNSAGDNFGRTLSFVADGVPTITGENGAVLSSGGVALQYVVTTLANGGELLIAYKGDARTDDARIFTLTLDPTSTHGSYSFNLLGTLDHATGSNSIGLTFGVQAADADGDTVNTSFVVNVADDAPVVAGEVAAHGVTEDGLAGANGFVAGAGSTGTVELNINWGTDNDTRGNSAGDTFGRTLSFVADGVPTLTGENGAVLSSGGVALQYVVTTLANGGELLIAYKGDARTDDARVFTLTLDPTSEHGSYSFNLLGTLDHATGSNSIGLTFGVQAADADGDTVNTSFVVNVADDLPVLAGTVEAHGVTEDGLAGANGFVADAGSTGAVELNINWGIDNDTRGNGAGDTFGRTLSFLSGSGSEGDSTLTPLTGSDQPVAFLAFAVSGENGGILSSGGVALQYIVTTLADGGQLLTAYKGDARGDDARVFTLTLDPTSEHGSYSFNLLGTLDHATGSDSIGLTFGVQAADADGDTINTSFVVNVADDVPVLAGEVAAHGVTEDGLAGANGFVADAGSTGAVDLNVNWGTDNDTRGNAAGDTFGRTLSFLSGSGSAGDPTLTPLTGSDQPVAFLAFAVSGENGGILSSGGVALQYIVTTLADGGQLLTAYKGDARTDDARVFTLTLDPTSEHGSYNFNLLGTLDHATGSDSIGLTFGVQAADADGDTINTSFVVNVADDVPVTAGEVGDQTVGEDGLGGANQTGPAGGYDAVDNTSVNGVALNVNWGTDNDIHTGAGDVVGRTLSFNMAGGVPVDGAGHALALSSDGVALQYVVTAQDNGGQILQAYRGGTHDASTLVFTVTLDPTSAHGSYSFVLNGNLDHATSGALGDELPLDFGLTATDADGDTVGTHFTVKVQDDVPVVGTAGTTSVNEDDLPNGNDLIKETRTVHGDLAISWGADDGAARHILMATDGLPAGLTSDGVAIVYQTTVDADGNAVVIAYKAGGSAGNAADQVFSLSFEENGSGTYTFRLLGNLDHAEGSDDRALQFTVNAYDSDGDSTAQSFTVHVADDHPIAIGQIVPRFVEEENLPGGNEDRQGSGDFDQSLFGTPINVTTTHTDGLLNILWGSDNANTLANGGYGGTQVAGDRSVVFGGTGGAYVTDGAVDASVASQFLSVSGGLTLATLTSGGEHLVYTLSGNGTVLTATTEASHKAVFTVTLSDQNGGSYAFDLLGALDHPVKGNSPAQEDILTFTFTFTARDGDGDIAQNDFTVNVSDDSPVIDTPQSLTVAESTTTTIANTFIAAEASGSLGVHWGADNNNSGSANRSVAFTEATLDALADLNLRSNGTKITYSLSADDTLLTAKAGGVSVFTIQLSDASDNGSYTFRLLDNIDHHGSGANVQNLTFGFFATDSDGDTTAPASFTVSITDDVPVAGVGDDATIAEKYLLSGTDPHIFDLTVSGKLNIDWNSDDHNSGGFANRSVSFAHSVAADNVTVTDANGAPVAFALTSDGNAVNYAVVGGILYGYTTSILNPVFLVTLNDSGTGGYTFTLLGNLDHGSDAANYQLNLTFSYTATDSDGDSSSNVFTVAVLDDAPVAGVGDHGAVNENDLTNGTSPDAPVRAHGDLNIAWGADHNNPTSQGGAHDRSVAFSNTVDPAANVTSGLTSNGEAILYTLINGVLVGYTGSAPQTATASNVVFNVTLSDSGDGSYTFTLLGNLDHAAGNGSNTLDLIFNYTATDSDGDSASNTFTVTVVDDIPTGGQVVSSTTAVSEAALLTSSPADNQISGDLNDGVTANGEVVFGADGYKAGSLAINQTGVTVFDGNGNVETGFVLRSEGQQVKFVSDGTTLYGYVGTHSASYVASHPSVQVFKLALDPATGGYTFTLLAPLDHTGSANNTDLILGFGLKAQDGDSDPVTFTLKLDVTDTVPTAAGGDASSISESNTRSGTDPFFFGLFDPTSNGSLNVSWGADDNNSGSANRSVAFVGYTQDQSAAAAGIGSLTSNGQEIHVRVVGTTLYGYTGSAPSNPNAAPSSSQQVFKVELSDSGAGSYKFTLLGNLDHPAPSGGANDANTLTLHFNYTATDADGDTTAPASFDVTVIDDVLQLGNADHGYVAEGALSGGNGVGIVAGFFGVSQTAVGSLHISWGADRNDPDSGANDRSVKFDSSLDHATASFTSHGEAVSYSLSSDGTVLTATTASHHAVFTITLSDNAQGGYTFTLQGPIDHGTSGLADLLGDLNFGFVATDSDGDSKSGSFQITIIDDVPVAPGVTITGTLVHDESAGQQSAAGADDVAAQPDVFAGIGALGGLTAIGYASDTVVSVTPHDGADGHLSTALALTNALGGQFNGAATNLFDTATGHRIFLYSDASGVVFGRVGSGDGLLTASSGGAIAFAIGIDNSQSLAGNSGVLSVAEYRAISHPDSTDANDSVTLKSGLLGGDLLYVTASTTDFDHDSAIFTTTKPLTVSFLDDAPTTAGYVGAVTVSEHANAATGAFIAQTANGVMTFDGGADGARITALHYGPVSGPTARVYDADAGNTPVVRLDLTSGGHQVFVDEVAGLNGPMLVGKLADGTMIFKLEVTNATTGAYTFTQFGPIDHPDVNESGAADPVRMDVSFIVTDNDGDTASGHIHVDINDDAPELRGGHGLRYITVSEGDLGGGSDSASYDYTAGANPSIHYGADGFGSSNFTGYLKLDIGGHLAGNVTFDLTNGPQSSAKFTSGGEVVVFELVDPTTIRGTIDGGSTTVVELKLVGSTVTTTLYHSLDHLDAQTGEPLQNMLIDAGMIFTDGDGDSVSSTIRTTIVDDTPTAHDVNGTMGENDTHVINLVEGTDYSFGADAHGAAITLAAPTFSNVPAGVVLGTPTVTLGPDGHTITITPGTAFDALPDGSTATMHIAYTVTDGDGDAVTRDIAVTINGTNDAPVITWLESAGSITEVTDQTGSSQNLHIQRNIAFTDVDLVNGVHALEIVPVTSTNPNGTFIGTPSFTVSDPTGNADGSSRNVLFHLNVADQALDFLGAGETFTQSYQVRVFDGSDYSNVKTITITFKGANDIAVISGDVSDTVTEDSSADINAQNKLVAEGVLTVTDADHDQSAFQPQTDVARAYGAFSIDANGHWTYLVDNDSAVVQWLGAGQSLTDTVTVSSLDGSATQTITVTINGTNDAPVVDLSGPSVAGNDVTTTAVEQLPQWILNAATINDVDSSTLAHMTVTLESPPDGALETLSLNASAQAAVNTNPGLSWSYDAATGVLSVTGVAATSVYQTILKGIVYFNNSDDPTTTDRTVHVVVNDGLADSAQQTATVHVWATNDPPVLQGSLHATMDEGTSHTISPTELGFTDPDNIAAEVSFHVSNQVNGIVMLDGVSSLSFTGQQLLDGHVTFVHDGSATTSASFDVYVEDGNQDGSTPVPGHFTIDVNQAPVAVADSYATYANTALTVDVAHGLVSNDTDAEHSALASILNQGPAHGTLLLNSNGSFTYTPNMGFSGQDSFTYHANDGSLDSNIATVTIDVTAPPNAAPTHNGATIFVNQHDASPFTIPSIALLWGETDPDHDVLSISAVDPNNAKVGLSTDHQTVAFQVTGNAGSSGDFDYSITDGVNTVDATAHVTRVNGALTGDADANILIDNSGHAVNLYGYGGNDVLIANAGPSQLFGDDPTLWAVSSAPGGNDLLIGSSANDALYGEGGNDTLIGGKGIDSLFGGSGADTFVFNEAGALNKDVIHDYNRGSGSYNQNEGDKIDLSGLLDGIFNQGTNAGNDTISNYVQIVSQSGTATLQVDLSGGTGANHSTHNWQDVAALTGVSNAEIVNVVFAHQDHNIAMA